MKRIIFYFLLACTYTLQAQEIEILSVEKIMRDPKWIGVSPDNIRWDESSKNLYFNWNPENVKEDPLYKISPTMREPQMVSKEIAETLEKQSLSYNKNRSKVLFERNGDIFILNLSSGKEDTLIHTLERESNPFFDKSESKIFFQRGDNLYSISVNGSKLSQLSNFTHNRKKSPLPLSKQDQWLKKEQINEFDIIKKRESERTERELKIKANEAKLPKEFYLDEGSFLSGMSISPDEKFISFRIMKRAEGNKNTIIPNYMSTSAYTEDINGRTKVGQKLSSIETYMHDLLRDSIYQISAKDIPGIKDLPDYLKDYPEQQKERIKKNEDRKVSINGPFWNLDGSRAIVTVAALDNKDRWIMKLDPQTAKLSLLDRQRDEAWIGGPGIGGVYGGGNIGWIDANTIYFQSEATGYSHIYTLNLDSGEKKQITSGKYEVQSLQLSNDKKNFYFGANIEHPGISHFYRISISGGNPIKLSSMKGGNEVSLSPDEKWLAIRYSYSNKPWELYLQENKAGAKSEKITDSQRAEFKAYKWREPEVVTYKNRYGSDIYARIYKPENQAKSKPAIVFVHGAGYLQNVHYWWSQYFREYMFNNLLADKGYTVIDIDYTASSGYGRDHRTGIYRHMGGKDLSDQVDGVKLLVEKYDVNPANIGIYGGSYGGFMALMALFNESDVFKSGAALRSVTDWAHYNHGYTSNILNEPANDELAYKRSSPIYFAEGLKGNLLMAHGMVDVNVHFQDIVRLSQRLIELKKEHWELAVYPVEDHGFVEPSSWTDEYKRILKLFETTLK